MNMNAQPLAVPPTCKTHSKKGPDRGVKLVLLSSRLSRDLRTVKYEWVRGVKRRSLIVCFLAFTLSKSYFSPTHDKSDILS